MIEEKKTCINCGALYEVKHDLPEEDYIERFCPFCGEEKEDDDITGYTAENFADGKKPGRKGLSKRVGVSQKMSIAQLAKIAKTASGERKRMAQWNLNMKRGRKKKK